MTALSPAEIALYLLAGGALGVAYFLLLLRTARLFAAQGKAGQGKAATVVPLYLLRIGGAVAVFWLIAQQGALALLLALAGFLVARFGVQHWAGTRE